MWNYESDFISMMLTMIDKSWCRSLETCFVEIVHIAYNAAVKSYTSSFIYYYHVIVDIELSALIQA